MSEQMMASIRQTACGKMCGYWDVCMFAAVDVFVGAEHFDSAALFL